MGETKRCNVCQQDKPLDQFYRASGCVDGRRGDCRTCFQAKAKQRKEADPALKEIARRRTARWIADNRERYDAYKARYRKSDNYKRAWRKWYLKDKYGITPDDYARRLQAQGGGCAICGEPPGEIALHVDHCHETGRVRGLLCFSCNAGLGQFRHDPELLGAARTYAAVHWRVEDLKAAGRAPRGERS
jgi:hypothetical protein